MKMSMFEMAMICGAMYVLGSCFMNNNPEMIDGVKKKIKDTSKMIYTKLDKMENGD